MLRMAVLLSGSGRTLDNFHDRIEDGSLNASVEVVVSNVADALGLQKAKNYGYPAFHAVGSEAINTILSDYTVDIVCLAGYLKLYEPPESLKRAVINIHPALIPSFCGSGFYGSRVHRAVKEKGCTVSGCTVHFANEHYDEGPIILQKCVELGYDETIDAIASKVFAAECLAFPEAINAVDKLGIDFFLGQGEGVSGEQKIIMTEAEIELAVKRIALQILEKNSGVSNLAVVGIHTCGVYLAKRIVSCIEETSGSVVGYGSLDITLYRDDWSLITQNPVVKTTDISFPVEGTTLVLVDDVIYTGRTIRAAMDAIMDYGRPHMIQLAVLVDRGGRELPIQPDYTGMVTSVREKERIQVMMRQEQGAEKVVIES